MNTDWLDDDGHPLLSQFQGCEYCDEFNGQYCNMGFNNVDSEDYIECPDEHKTISGYYKWAYEAVYRANLRAKKNNVFSDLTIKQLIQLREENTKCYICSKSFIDKNPIVHHVVELIKGGTNTINNIKLPCEECHKKILHEEYYRTRGWL